MAKTIYFKGFDFEVDYNYQPYEAQTYEYPGSPAYYEFYNIKLNGIDASELLEHCIEDFEDEAIKQLTDGY